jgi:DnaJ-class molecular chaperone
MDPRVINALSQWFMYFLPSIVAWIRMRMGKKVVTSVGSIFSSNLFLGWTVVVWILCMLNALGYNPVRWVVLKMKFAPGGGGAPMNAPQAAWDSPSQRQVCSQCGGTGYVMCPQCYGKGSWYTQPTTAHEIAQLQTCTYCMASGHIRCPSCGGVHG